MKKEEKIMCFCFAESAVLLLLNIAGVIQTSVAVCLIPVILFLMSAAVSVVAALLLMRWLLKADNFARLDELMEKLEKEEEKTGRKKDD